MRYTKPLPPLEHLKNWFVYDPEEGTLFSKSSQRYINSVEVRLPHPTNPKYKRRTALVCYKLAHGVEPKIIKYVDGNLLNWKAENLVDRILTLEQIKEIVKQYDNITDFRLNESGASQQLDKYFKDQREEVFAHLRKAHSFSDTLSRRKELDISDELHESICDYITLVKTEKGEISQKDFVRKLGSPVSSYKIKKLWGSYLFFAEEFGISDKFNGSKINPLTYEECLEVAQQCESWHDFCDNQKKYYDWAKYRNLLNDLMVESNLKKRPVYSSISDVSLLDQANDFCKTHSIKTAKEFRDLSAGLGAEVWRRKLQRRLDVEFGEWTPPGETKYSKDEIKEIAESCESVDDFRNRFSGMYGTAKRNGWLDDVLENVDNSYTQQNIIYFWNSEEFPDVWKIGISNDNFRLGRHKTMWRYRVALVATCANLTPQRIFHKVTSECREIELELLKMYTKYDWNAKFDGSSEFLRLSKSESENVINQYFT